MKIEHLAIWANDIELLRQFYTKYFGMICGDKYVNLKKSYTAYFLSFGEDRTRIELMHIPDMLHDSAHRGNRTGLAHFAMSVGSKERVDALTARLRSDGFEIASEPRFTGDGYYESLILDPEGNCVEVTE